MGENAAPGLISELKLAVPWGHIAAKAWGSLQGPPVLCLHGWLDNANSFDRLIPLLPQDFYYVAMDFGGHGLSSHYSPGVPYYQQTFVSEIRRVVADLKWNRFSILGHSFGGIVGGMVSRWLCVANWGSLGWSREGSTEEEGEGTWDKEVPPPVTVIVIMPGSWCKRWKLVELMFSRPHTLSQSTLESSHHQGLEFSARCRLGGGGGRHTIGQNILLLAPWSAPTP
uniref:AB hydrolase-1 domain-containing protein n=1 Tax=Piliocolobus tephrosceles TaxID=591936 RepID=A0A8C9HFB5_9PRIM